MDKNVYFMDACKNGNKGVAIALLKKGGINVNYRDDDGNSPIFYASMKGAKELVKLLLEKEADVSLANNTDKYPIHAAAQGGNREIMEMLIENGADVNEADKSSMVPLTYAILAKKTEAAKYLILKGADLRIKDQDGKSPINYIETVGMLGLIEFYPADIINEADNVGNRPIHRCCINNQSEILKEILKSEKVDKDARDGKNHS